LFNWGVTLVVAKIVADGQILQMTAAAIAQWIDVFQRGGRWQHMQPTDPARHNTMQLARYCLIYFVPGVRKFAHGVQCTGSKGLSYLHATMTQLSAT
jgi:hypothetical protein